MAENNDLFLLAAERMRSNAGLSLNNEQKLTIYGYYKQATEGPCNVSKPGYFDFTGRAKWEAWNNLGQMSQDEAKTKYIAFVSKIDPGWQDTPVTMTSTNMPSSPASAAGGPVVSRMACEDEDDIPDSQKTLLDWCSEGAIKKVEECLKKTDVDINVKDEEGMVPLHWACDRGNIEIVNCLILNGAQINIKDNDGQTPLHYATSCGHREVVMTLLKHGADHTCLDNSGQSAQEICEPSIKDVFQNIKFFKNC